MATVTQAWLLAATADGNHDGSSDTLELQVGADGLDIELKTDDVTAKNGSKSSSSDMVQWTWTSDYWDGFTWDPSLDPSNYNLETTGSDMWLPSAIWLITLDSDNNFNLAVSIPNWPSEDAFSKDSSEGNTSYDLGTVESEATV